VEHGVGKLTRYQRVALVVLGLAMAGAIFAGLGVTWVFVGLGLCVNAFRERILWRVRNRLLLTFFLLGVVPLILIGVMAMFTLVPFLGYLASQRVEADLDHRIAVISTAAGDLAVAGSQAASAQLLDGLRRSVPRMGATVRVNGQTLVLPSNSPIQEIPQGLAPTFQGLIEFQGNYFLAARARGDAFGAEVLAYVPFDEETRTSLTGGVVEVLGAFSGDENINQKLSPQGAEMSVARGKGKRATLRAQRLRASQAWWDVPVGGILSRPLERVSAKPGRMTLVSVSTASLVLSPYLNSADAQPFLFVFYAVGGVLLLVLLFSFVRSVFHTREITRSVHEMYAGTLKVAAGDFAYKIPVRGKNQLSELAGSFNGMSSQIQHFLGEMKKKEKIESELEIARQVQARLFPRSVPELRTLDMAGTCIPGRFISGDYYDYVKLNDRYTAIALGDVSGKGVSAALLMASIQASLHAQLGFARGAESPVLSTATLMALIGQQLYESTPAEKYATFFCSVYDDETGVLRYTNAGHLQPILVRAGKSSALPGGGMVVGLLPNVKYEQLEVQLQHGDLLAIFSDGIPEAENAVAQEYGEARLAELLVANSGAPLDAVIETVTKSVDSWAHDPASRDDTTIVVMRRR
jgi:sigma-B regulation protein RsbU (phosphoserine phosphatase)